MVSPIKLFQFSVASMKFVGLMALSLAESNTNGGRFLLRTVPDFPHRSAFPIRESFISLDWLLAGDFFLFGYLHGSILVAFVVFCCSHETMRDLEVKSPLFTMAFVRASLQFLLLLPLVRSFIISGDVGLVLHPHPLEVISITRPMSRCDVDFLAISPIAEPYTVLSLVIHRGPRDFAEQMGDLQRWDLSMKQRPPRKPPWNQHITADIGEATRMRIRRSNQQHVWVYGTITTTYVSIFRRVPKSRVLRCNG